MYQNNGYPAPQGGYAPQTNYQQGNGYSQPAQTNDLGWDDEFAAEESARSVLLPEGDYWFEVVKLERARHSGSAKTPPCNKAVVTFRIYSPLGEATLTENFFVIDLDWARNKMTAFFAGIGIASQEDVEVRGRVRPVWTPEIIGRRGVCHIAPRSYEKDGETKQTNDLKFIYYKWKQPNMEPLAPAGNSGYQPQQNAPQMNQYQPPQNQGWQPQNNGYNPPAGGGYGGGIY